MQASVEDGAKDDCEVSYLGESWSGMKEISGRGERLKMQWGRMMWSVLNVVGAYCRNRCGQEVIGD